MRKIVSLVLALCLLFVFAGCTTSATPTPAPTDANPTDAAPTQVPGTLEDIKNRGKLIMLTNAAFPPFEYVDDGVEKGVDVDVARAIAEDLGVTLEVLDMDFDGLIAALASGKGDLIAAGMTIREDRLESVDFSTEYVTSSQFMIVGKDSTLATLEDLKGKTIGVQTGTTGDFLVDDAINLETGVLHGTGATLKQYKNALEASLELQNGRLDAVIIDRHPANAIVANNSNLKVVEQSVSDEESYAIAVRKGNASLLAAVNETLERLIAEGKVDQFLVDHTTN